MPVIAIEERAQENLWDCLSNVMRLLLDHDYATVSLFVDHYCICDYQNWVIHNFC